MKKSHACKISEREPSLGNNDGIQTGKRVEWCCYARVLYTEEKVRSVQLESFEKPFHTHIPKIVFLLL